jgi:hypothetical protein
VSWGKGGAERIRKQNKNKNTFAPFASSRMRAVFSSSLLLVALFFATCAVSQGDDNLGPGEWKLVFRQKDPSLGGAWWPRSDLYRYNPTDDTAPLYAILDELVSTRGEGRGRRGA